MFDDYLLFVVSCLFLPAAINSGVETNEKLYVQTASTRHVEALNDRFPAFLIRPDLMPTLFRADHLFAPSKIYAKKITKMFGGFRNFL